MANIEPNKEYTRYKYRWQKVRDVVDGEDRLKEVDLSRIGQARGVVSTSYNGISFGYLRLLNYQADQSDYNKSRNAGYVEGAHLYNATGRTLAGLMGMVFRVKPNEPDLPRQIRYIIDNADGSGLSLDQQAQSVTEDVASIGRDGLLVDMPRNDEGQEVSQLDVDNGFRARILEYKAENIIDWNESVIDGVKKLDLLVLREVTEEYADDDPLQIKRTQLTKYRVYRLVEGVVEVQIYREDEDYPSESVPVNFANGVRATEIPFVFVGSKDNSPCVDKLPMEDLANVNIGHYQESANLALGSFNFGAAQPFVADDKYQQYARNKDASGEKEEIQLGDGVCMILGTGGVMAYAVPPANTMSGEIRTDYANQMVALGAQLISDGGQAETAEAARLKHASDVSVLSRVVRNVSAAYNKCLWWVAAFMGVTIPEDQKYMINDVFFESKLTPEQTAALVSTWQAGAISKSVLDIKLLDGGLIPEGTDLDLMNGAIESEIPSVNLDD